MKQRVEYEYDSVLIEYNSEVQPAVLLIAEEQIAAIAYNILCIPLIISYLHTTTGFPVKETWINVINKGWYITWPRLTVCCVH